MSTVDPLARYRSKRDFGKTPEPPAELGASGEKLGFVIQKHAASRLHYDFRLELDGVMLSWAVPKGPSFDPRDKRLAVQTEDHPISYNTFEGTIPKGQYGAGDVLLWDRGSWTPVGDPRDGLKVGKLLFTLDGYKLAGLWELVRIAKPGEKQVSWILFKKHDEYERPREDYDVVSALPDSVVAKPPKQKPRPSGASANSVGGPSGPIRTKQRAPRKTIGPEGPPTTPTTSPAALPHAKRTPLPATLKPQLATLTTHIPEDAPTHRWLYEIKFDGYRILARVDAKGSVKLITRGGHDWAAKLPRLAKELAALKHLHNCWLDGEIVVLDRHGVPSFNALQQAFDGSHTTEVVYFVFDVPFAGGYDLRQVPLEQRRALLAGLLGDGVGSSSQEVIAAEAAPAKQLGNGAGKGMRGGRRALAAEKGSSAQVAIAAEAAPTGRKAAGRRTTAPGVTPMEASAGGESLVRYSADFPGDPSDILASACRMKLEGLIAKRSDAPYVSSRSTTWLKLKCKLRQEFVIAGFTDRSDKRDAPEIGSLLLGVHDKAGDLVSAGSVGTGWNAKVAAELKGKLLEIEQDKSPFAETTGPAKKSRWSAKRAAGAERWVKPQLVAEVNFAEWTPDGSIRHASFVSLRADKLAKKIVREDAVEEDMNPVGGPSGPMRSTQKAHPAGGPSGPIAAPRKTPIGPEGPPTTPSRRTTTKLTNPTRVIDPSTGLTKLDLFRYYESVADWMLPHLKGRPVALVRGPSGVDGQLFFQKHADEKQIPGINTLDPSLIPEHEALIEVPSAKALASAAQMNVIEFHTWNGLARMFDTPDRIIFDLDPGEGVKFDRVREAAALLHAFLQELGLEAWLKTSGGKGLHVVVPIAPRHDWDTAKDFSRAVVQHVAKVVPDRFVAKSGPSNRIGKIFIDYLRNARGATTAAAFSARSRPGLGVSMPVSWEALDDLKSGAQWTIATAREYLSFQKEDPWAGYWKSRQTLTKAIKKLGP